MIDELDIEVLDESPTSSGDSGESVQADSPDELDVQEVGNGSDDAEGGYPSRAEVAAWVQDILDATPDVSRLASVPTSQELAVMLADAVEDVAVEPVDSETLAEGIAAALPDTYSVTLTSTQFDKLRGDAATNFLATVACVGMLACILGALVATAVTLHWRGR